MSSTPVPAAASTVDASPAPAGKLSRARIVWSIAGRDLRSHLFGLSLYVVVALVLLGISHFAVRNALWQVDQNGLMVLGNPINYPFFLALWLSAVYLGLMAAVAIARERDNGTLEVLFYGPVDSLSYLLGKFVQPMISFVVVAAFYLAYFAASAWYTNLGFTGGIVQLLVLALVLTGCVVAFGLAISAVSRRVFLAVIGFLGLMVLFTLFSVAQAVLLAIPAERLTDVLAFARTLVDNVQRGLQWLSPLAYFSRGSAALLIGEWQDYLIAVGSSLVYTAVLVALAVFAFQRKGVRR
ncbi:MAG: ABC transporter permease subunit [Limnochordaceae bacterium]|nr:ABC transporter permease subunit [Limnochordaceae bacterium]